MDRHGVHGCPITSNFEKLIAAPHCHFAGRWSSERSCDALRPAMCSRRNQSVDTLGVGAAQKNGARKMRARGDSPTRITASTSVRPRTSVRVPAVVILLLGIPYI